MAARATDFIHRAALYTTFVNLSSTPFTLLIFFSNLFHVFSTFGCWYSRECEHGFTSVHVGRGRCQGEAVLGVSRTCHSHPHCLARNFLPTTSTGKKFHMLPKKKKKLLIFILIVWVFTCHVTFEVLFELLAWGNSNGVSTQRWGGSGDGHDVLPRETEWRGRGKACLLRITRHRCPKLKVTQVQDIPHYSLSMT